MLRHDRTWPLWRRPHIRFGVRAFMAIVIVLGGGLAWIVRRAHEQRDAVDAVRRAGGTVYYEWRTTDPTECIIYAGKPSAPQWLVDRPGFDYLGSVVDVSFHTHGPVSEDDMVKIGGLRRLEHFGLSGSGVTDQGMLAIANVGDLKTLDLTHNGVTDAGIAHLRGLNRLKRLRLQGARISDAGLTHLSSLGQLEFLDPRNTLISDAGLRQLKRMSQLKTLILAGPTITDDGIRELQNARPEMTVVAPDRPDTRIVHMTSAMHFGAPSPNQAEPARPDSPRTSKSSN
jgi:internalin A